MCRHRQSRRQRFAGRAFVLGGSMQSAARRTALLGILCAEAIALSALEGLIPQFIPVPGIKRGFFNIVTMYAVISLATPYALLITLFSGICGVDARSHGGILSLCGALMSLAVMVVFFRLLPGRLGLLGTRCFRRYSQRRSAACRRVYSRKTHSGSPVSLSRQLSRVYSRVRY